MFKKAISLFIALYLAVTVFSSVDVNTADEDTLDTIKGIGPATAKAIVAERSANGEFKDFADLAARIKGLGEKKVEKLKDAGLTIGQGDSATDARKAK